MKAPRYIDNMHRHSSRQEELRDLLKLCAFYRPYQYKYIADATVSTVRLGLGKQGRFCLSMTHLLL